MKPRVSAAVFLLLGAATMAHLGAQQPPRFTKQDGDRFQTKLVRIVEAGNGTRTRTEPALSTQMTDTEVTAYLRYNAREQVPVGIVEPTLTALGDGRVAGRAIVDLDAVRAQKQRGWLDPLLGMTGKLPLTATGTLIT